MKFKSASLVEQVVWDMRLADMPRGTNRALIDRLANGNPPWTQAEAEDANINTNVNWLSFPKLIADARRSYANAFMKPGVFFKVSLDGTKNAAKRREWGAHVTRAINKIMKDSPDYLEFLRSQFALTVLHGVGPGFWCDKDHWCPTCLGIQDILIPSNSLLSFKNVTHFAVFRQYTAMEMRIMTQGQKVDPAWNMDMVNSALEWVDDQTRVQLAYSDLYAPQNVEERFKQDLGFYGTDSVPTIDCWDFYFWSNEGDKEGWRRRMILDTPTSTETKNERKMPETNKIGKQHGQWLYCPKEERVYAEKIRNILHYQFGDASAVAPFRYHSVRSLGWLLYAVCHLDNRLRCKFNDSLFEHMLQYVRVANPDDHERPTKIDLHNYGVIPEGVDFVKAQERWNINMALVQMGFQQNRSMMDESAAQYREGRDIGAKEGEKTATQIMAEVNSANALVGSMLLQAYAYQKFQYMEIARRFCKSNSTDPEVKKFRLSVLKAGVPEEYLDIERWDIEPERVLGSGNKTLEIAMADKLMAARNLHDPDSQRTILRIYDMANSDNPGLIDDLVPEKPTKVTDSVHDAQLMVGSLMQGIPMTPKSGQNASEVVETLMVSLGGILKITNAKGPQATPQDIIGMQTVGHTIGQYIQILSSDPNEKDRVKKYAQTLTKLMQEVKKAGDALKASTQQQPGGQPGQDPETAAKLQGQMMINKVKADNMAQSHAQRTQQKQAQFQQKLAQDQQKHQAELDKKGRELQANTAAKDIETAAAIRRDGAKARMEMETAEAGDTGGEE